MARIGIACAPELEILWRRVGRLAPQIDSLRLGICRISCGNGANRQYHSESGRTMEGFCRAAPIDLKSSWKERVDSGHAASLAKNRTRFLGMSPRGEIAFPMGQVEPGPYKLSIERHGTEKGPR